MPDGSKNVHPLGNNPPAQKLRVAYIARKAKSLLPDSENYAGNEILSSGNASRLNLQSLWLKPAPAKKGEIEKIPPSIRNISKDGIEGELNYMAKRFGLSVKFYKGDEVFLHSRTLVIPERSVGALALWRDYSNHKPAANEPDYARGIEAYFMFVKNIRKQKVVDIFQDSSKPNAEMLQRRDLAAFCSGVFEFGVDFIYSSPKVDEGINRGMFFYDFKNSSGDVEYFARDSAKRIRNYLDFCDIIDSSLK